MAGSAPVEGHGVGSFARQWPVLRPPQSGHILQPHSIEFEEFAELGVVGLLLFAGAWVLILRCPNRRSAPLAAAATASALILLLQASVDWTWSFAGLVVPVFLVVGAASAGSPAAARARLWSEVATAAVALGALVVLAAPYLAHRAVATASGEQSTNPSHALSRVDSATRLNPWDPEAYTLQGEVLEAHGNYSAAAAAYAKSARDALEPYVSHLEEARAAGQAGQAGRARGACEAALVENPYVADDVTAFCPRADGRAWPLRATAAPAPYARLLASKRCSSCAVQVRGGAVAASVPGGFAFRDSAFAVLDLGAAARGDTLAVSARLSLGRMPAGDVSLLDVRDGSDQLLYSLFARRRTGELFLYNPPGGIKRESFVLDLHAVVPLAPHALNVRVVLQRNTSLEVRADGRVRARMPGPGLARPSGARTGLPRYVEAGILSYESNRLNDLMRALVSNVTVHSNPA